MLPYWYRKFQTRTHEEGRSKKAATIDHISTPRRAPIAFDLQVLPHVVPAAQLRDVLREDANGVASEIKPARLVRAFPLPDFLELLHFFKLVVIVIFGNIVLLVVLAPLFN